MLTPGGIVNVICSDASHEGKVAKIIQFRRVAVDEDADYHHFRGSKQRRWSRGQITYSRRNPTVPVPKSDWPRPYDDTLVDDVLIKNAAQRVALDPTHQRARQRRSMKCPLCGIKVDARAETLYPILDKLVDHGVSRVELAHLARILST